MGQAGAGMACAWAWLSRKSMEHAFWDPGREAARCVFFQAWRKKKEKADFS